MTPTERNQWEIIFHDEFEPEYKRLSPAVQDELVALTVNVRKKGPLLGRPQLDTLKGSAFPNMKELRFTADGGVWRVAFAFDPERNAILLVAANKAGTNQRRFYLGLIHTADARFAQHLRSMVSKGKKDARNFGSDSQ